MRLLLSRQFVEDAERLAVLCELLPALSPFLFRRGVFSCVFPVLRQQCVVIRITWVEGREHVLNHIVVLISISTAEL